VILSVRVKLVIAETPEVVLQGVKVALYDRDQASMDDHLGSGVTDETGQIRFVFDSDSYMDEEDLPLWKVDSLPELYVMVFNRDGEVILSTREQAIDNHLPKLITVGIPSALAVLHGLL